MITIYKYPLRVTDTQPVMMPEGAQILSVHCQKDTVCLWALVDTEKPLKQRLIHIALGQELGKPGHKTYPPFEMRFIGTVQLDSELVWHIFERL